MAKEGNDRKVEQKTLFGKNESWSSQRFSLAQISMALILRC